jgi:hypothetical protein
MNHFVLQKLYLKNELKYSINLYETNELNQRINLMRINELK